jgi:hypothetical protein
MSQSTRGVHKLGRRLFVRGALGVTVGLPLLESFFPRRADAQQMVQRYAIFMRQGNGVQQALGTSEPDRFWPTKLGVATRRSTCWRTSPRSSCSYAAAR